MKELRKYQIEIKNQIKQDFNSHFEVVMAMCPNAGKTLTTIKLMEELIQEGKVKKILVLAHGTTVLRSQFYNNLVEEEPNFTFKELSPENKDIDAQVLVGLPQGLKNTILNDVDLIVCDEAHERYLEKQVQGIVKNSQPNNILLLTGTPSPFILHNNTKKERFKINLIAMSDIVKYMANPQVFICSSSYNIKDIDFNGNNDVKSKHVFSKKDTISTLDTFIGEAVKTLKMNKISNLDNLFQIAFGKLKKTMFVCNSQIQAKQVNKYLNQKGVSSLISTQDTDLKSDNIQIFIKDDSFKVLVVVNRGILGFNLPTLTNVVDMSATRNIDRMYQMFSRITRVHPNINIKRYFKIAPKGETEHTEYITAAMLSLIHRDNIVKYNGRNFKTDLPILIEKNKEKTKKTRKIQKKNKTTSKMHKFQGLDVIVEFTKLFSNPSKTFQIYSKINLEKALLQMGKIKKIYKHTYKGCLDFAAGHSTWCVFSKEHNGIAQFLRKNNSVDQFCKDADLTKKQGKYTYESCRHIGKKIKTFKDLKKHHGGTVQFLYKNNLVDKFCEEFNLNKNKISNCEITYDICVKSGKKYDSYTTWRKENSTMYKFICKRSITDKFCKDADLTKQVSQHTYESCVKASRKLDSLISFTNSFGSMVQFLRNNKLMDEFIKETGLNRKNGACRYSFDMCVKEGIRQGSFLNFRTNSKPFYAFLKRKSLIDLFLKKTNFFDDRHQQYTYEDCIAEVGQNNYDSLTEFAKIKNNLYSFLKRNKLLDRFSQETKLISIMDRKIKHINTGIVYNNSYKLAFILNINPKAIARVASGSIKEYCGHKFEYCR